MNPEPNHSTLVVEHSPNHQTIWVQSKFDTSCQRCSIINKVISLRRKSIAGGASFFEAASAQKIANELTAKYQLTKAECLDRLYTSPSQSDKAKSEKIRAKTRQKQMEEV